MIISQLFSVCYIVHSLKDMLKPAEKLVWIEASSLTVSYKLVVPERPQLMEDTLLFDYRMINNDTTKGVR